MGNETLSALLFLNKQFKKIVHKGSMLEKLDKPKDPKAATQPKDAAPPSEQPVREKQKNTTEKPNKNNLKHQRTTVEQTTEKQ